MTLLQQRVDECAPGTRDRARRRRQVARADAARAAAAARALDGLATRAPLLEIGQLDASACTRQAPADGDDRRHRGRAPARMHDRRQRRDGEGLHLTRMGVRASRARRSREEPAAVNYLVDAAPFLPPRTSLSDASTSAGSFQPGQIRAGHRPIAVVMGSCTAGGAYVPARATNRDRQETGTISSAAPVVKAAIADRSAGSRRRESNPPLGRADT